NGRGFDSLPAYHPKIDVKRSVMAAITAMHPTAAMHSSTAAMKRREEAGRDRHAGGGVRRRRSRRVASGKAARAGHDVAAAIGHTAVAEAVADTAVKVVGVQVTVQDQTLLATATLMR